MLIMSLKNHIWIFSHFILVAKHVYYNFSSIKKVFKILKYYFYVCSAFLKKYFKLVNK